MAGIDGGQPLGWRGAVSVTGRGRVKTARGLQGERLGKLRTTGLWRTNDVALFGIETDVVGFSLGDRKSEPPRASFQGHLV
jgi:hypothetical protein